MDLNFASGFIDIIEILQNWAIEVIEILQKFKQCIRHEEQHRMFP